MARWDLLSAPVAAATVAAGVLLLDPLDGEGIRLICPMHEVTGWWCPGCGATRATWLLLHGDVAGAVHNNALFLPFLAFLAVRYLHLLAPARTAWAPRFVRAPSAIPSLAFRALVLVVVAFTVARNLPAFSWLAPPELPGGNR